MEKYVIYRRNREDSIHRKWKEAEKYFKNCEVKCSKYTELSSSECYQASMSAYQERKDKEANEKALNERRKKLSALLQKENEHYEVSSSLGIVFLSIYSRTVKIEFQLPFRKSSNFG